MSKSKTLWITVLFVLAITGIRLIWITLQAPPEHPHAVQGVLDLRNWDMNSKHSITLDGEWEFYPNQLIMNGDQKPEAKTGFIQVPGSWKSSFPDSNSPIGYGSYRLRILVNPSDKDHIYAFRVMEIVNSSELFVNGRQIAHAGKPASSHEEYIPRRMPYSEVYTTDLDVLDVVIHVANYVNPKLGGITHSIKFGDHTPVLNELGFSVGAQTLVSFLLLLHVVYVCILYFLGTPRKVLITFALLTFSAILMTLTDDDLLLLMWLPINYSWTVKLQHVSLILAGLLLLRFITQLLPEYSKNKYLKYYFMLSSFTIIVILSAPVSFNLQILLYSFLILLIPGIAVPMIILRSAVRGDKDVIFLLLGVIALMTNAIWGFIKNTYWTDLNYYPVDLIITFLLIAAYWFKRFFRTSMQTQNLAEKLQKADKLKDDFLANTSHELRNPLHGILNFAQSVLDTSEGKLDTDNTKKLKTLITVGKRMTFLLNDLLELNRLKERGIALHTAPTRIQPLVLGVMDMLRYLVEGKPVQLSNTIPDGFPAVVADENRLIQILFNLVHNAVKFTDVGHITVGSVIRNGKAWIIVADSGIGMDAETQGRIFEPYEKGDNSMTAIGGGLGLGLSISKQLVELHGGALQVSSVLGKGTEFSFELPLSSHYDGLSTMDHPFSLMAVTEEETSKRARAENEPIVEQTVERITDKLSVLAVDDDSVNLSVLVNILSPEIYDIVTVTSGEEALANLDRREWDLVIADVMMPRMSGYELSHAIRERFSITELPILLLTARSQPEDIEAGFRSGANDYVTKPVDALELRSRVRALTELKKSVRERLRMEGAWLQAQIQPHFLYNTLTAVAALSEIDTSRMRSLLEAFSNYLRCSFDFQNAEQLVTLQHELDLVRSYLYIEKERFEDRLEVTWEVNEASFLRIPPLTIQPLVENAVRHGIMKRSRGGGVRIRVVEYEEYAEISIKDNGVGIEADKLKRILDPQSANAEKGIGLLNTDRRLKQIYGKGLQISSFPNGGTTVTFRVTRNNSSD
ncbi:hybrid sensor histidine kinase/response regulator [Cohnella mopanensis]|uniref:hybrid sensor histidine kinase/response regulator n=1 Tax=Cohnella mopanensis TaxID=2911966 RepID=UPI001EF8F7E5|nr:ATP-binding protein [Cohnella mopanensis]